MKDDIDRQEAAKRLGEPLGVLGSFARFTREREGMSDHDLLHAMLVYQRGDRLHVLRSAGAYRAEGNGHPSAGVGEGDADSRLPEVKPEDRPRLRSVL